MKEKNSAYARIMTKIKHYILTAPLLSTGYMGMKYLIMNRNNGTDGYQQLTWSVKFFQNSGVVKFSVLSPGCR